MRIELRHLRLVRAIVATGSVTRAAASLNLTQSALSHQLREIEGRLGTRLFLRTSRRMVPSPAGEQLALLASQVLPAIEEVEADFGRTRREGRHGVLRIATECYTCYHWLPPVLTQFRRRWPGVELRIVAEATRAPIPALLQGDLDVAIVAATDAIPRLERTALFEDELVVVLPPGHAWANKPHARPEDFARETLVLYTMPDEHSTVLHDILGPAGVQPAQLIRVQLTEGIVELVRAGLGVAVLARWAVAPLLATNELVAIPLARGGFRRLWSAYTRADQPVPPFVTAFVDVLRAGLQTGPTLHHGRNASAA